MLEVGDRVGVGEGGLKMGDDMRRRPLRGEFGRRSASQQGGSDRALGEVEPLPDALQSPVAQMALRGSARGGDAVGDGTQEELPEKAGGEAQPSDFIGEPNAERASAPATRVAVAAKDSAGAHGLFLGAALVEAEQKAVADERADGLAMRTGRPLEPFRNRVPFVVGAVKELCHAHGPSPRKSPNDGGGVKARYDKNRNAGCGVKSRTATSTPANFCAEFSK